MVSKSIRTADWVYCVVGIHLGGLNSSSTGASDEMEKDCGRRSPILREVGTLFQRRIIANIPSRKTPHPTPSRPHLILQRPITIPPPIRQKAAIIHPIHPRHHIPRLHTHRPCQARLCRIVEPVLDSAEGRAAVEGVVVEFAVVVQRDDVEGAEDFAVGDDGEGDEGLLGDAAEGGAPAAFEVDVVAVFGFVGHDVVHLGDGGALEGWRLVLGTVLYWDCHGV